MGMTKTIEIDGKQVEFKASAAIPRIYRVKYGRDIFKDLMKLDKELKENTAEQEKRRRHLPVDGMPFFLASDWVSRFTPHREMISGSTW